MSTTWRPGSGNASDPIAGAVQQAASVLGAAMGFVYCESKPFKGRIVDEWVQSLGDEYGGGATMVKVPKLKTLCCNAPKGLCGKQIVRCGKRYQVVKDEGEDSLGFCTFELLTCPC